MIYGKWTECMYSVDPRLYETYRKSDKRAAGEPKKLRTVSRAQRVDWHKNSCFKSSLVFGTCCLCLAPICDSAFVLK